jgi:antitoxin (DNA-binding transcriptional repressor) of toxin-antitoxin stability system
MSRTARSLTEETVPMRDAKANLSSLARQAKAGIRVVITNHGTPIADLVRHGTSSTPVTSLKHPRLLPEPIQLIGTGPSASELVLKDREG